MLTRRKTLLTRRSWIGSAIACGVRSTESRCRLVVPAAPGGAIDAIGRLYATASRTRSAKTWVIENRAGASNTLGAAEVACAAPDGTTLLTNADIHLMAKHVMRQAPMTRSRIFRPFRGWRPRQWCLSATPAGPQLTSRLSPPR